MSSRAGDRGGDRYDDDDYDDDDGAHPEHVALNGAGGAEDSVGRAHLIPVSGMSSSSIAANGGAFGSSTSSGGGGGGGGGVREGLELEDDDEEEVEVDSDLENELARNQQDEHARAGDADKEQRCANPVLLYFLGVIACLACEFLILLPAFYLRLFVIGLLYAVVWVSLTSCAVHMQVCPGKRRPHSTLALVLYVAALAAYIGGMGGAYYYKQAWYFDRVDTAYTHVNPHVSPSTGLEWSGGGRLEPKAPWPTSSKPLAEPLVDPTFLDFEQNMADKLFDSFTSFVWITNPPPNDGAVFVGVNVFDGVTYCAAAITDTQHPETPGNHPVIFYWAVAQDCCGEQRDGSARSVWTNCKYWGDNIPNTTAIVPLSAEVVPDRQFKPYRDAVAAYMEIANLGPDWNGADSLLVTVMTINDHYDIQQSRRVKAYLSLFISAGLWPVLLLLFFAAQWLGEKVVAWCGKRNAHRMA